MFITIAVIAYNEENTIKNILDDISRQDYDHNLMEVVLVDSASTDGTKAVMQKFADENKMGARQIVVLDNPKKTLPCGWNVLLDNYTGEAVIRVDAHAHIPVDFVSKNVKVLEEGEMVVGGVRPNIVDEETPWKDTLLLAESSMFGSSIAPYRNGGNGTEEKIYMKSLFHAAYRREVFEKIGHYKELPFVKDGDSELMHQPIDFLGINVYNGHEVSVTGHIKKKPGSPRTALGWPVTPGVMNYGIRYMYERYNLPIYIFEDGLACNDIISLDGKVHDSNRIDFLTRYLTDLEKAYKAGVPILGYFHWSFTDNFEWHSGYDPRLGLIYVDYETQQRIPKDSAYWYSDLIKKSSN